MYKTWMSLSRLSQEYEDGVEAFLSFALANGCDANLLPCPCAKCANTSKGTVNSVRSHLICNGMDLTYIKWIWHGEARTSSPSTHASTWVEESDTNCEFENPIDMIHDAYDVYEDDPRTFKTLLEDAEKLLYLGCSKFTKLSATVKLYNLKAKYSWSDSSFSDLLSLVKEMLPECNELPPSVYEAKKTLSTLGLEYTKIHACPNDCILYRKEYKDSTDCPRCGLSRWKVDKNKNARIGVPSKVLWYFPPIPRFRRMFRTKEISKELTWHADKRTFDGKLHHPADAPAWKLVDNKWPDFAAEPRNLRLALAADGINPHNLMNTSYSCWPVVLVTYNLPPWLCMKRKFMMLTLLISGPKQPGNDIDVYLAPLLDDLKMLWEVGIQAYDAFRDESFTLKSILLWTINDFPAYGSLSGCSVKGYKACPVCADNTSSRWLPHSRKISYTGHRKFLPRHLYRSMKNNNLKKVVFVNPFGVSHSLAKSLSLEDRARTLADRLMTSTSKQLVLAPWNTGDHWILTIIDPHKEKVYLMDPLGVSRARYADWVKVVQTAMNIFKSNHGSKSNIKKALSWKGIEGNKQPDGKQCGFYVMRYMKQIVEGFGNDESICLTSLFEKQSYTQVEIDEIREEWARCVIPYVRMNNNRK